jgi:hypothetical protein
VSHDHPLTTLAAQIRTAPWAPAHNPYKRSTTNPTQTNERADSNRTACTLTARSLATPPPDRRLASAHSHRSLTRDSPSPPPSSPPPLPTGALHSHRSLTRDSPSRQAPCFARMTKQFNQLTCFVAHSILEFGSAAERALAIQVHQEPFSVCSVYLFCSPLSLSSLCSLCSVCSLCLLCSLYLLHIAHRVTRSFSSDWRRACLS